MVVSRSDKCNDKIALKKLLRSIIIENQFQQALFPLDFHNGTFSCSLADLDNCQRCEIVMNKSLSYNSQACTACDSDADEMHSIKRNKHFVLSNRTKDIDHMALILSTLRL